MVGQLGFEPRSGEPESPMLNHYSDESSIDRKWNFHVATPPALLSCRFLLMILNY